MHDRSRFLVAIAFCAAAMPAWAHVDAAAGGWLAGLSHPWSGWDHVIAMVAVGLWGAQLGRPALWLLPVAFPLVMSLGGLAGLLGIALPAVELGIAASGIALGAAVLAAWRPALPVAAALVAIFAVFHGHAHGTELPAGADGLAYSAGFVIGTGALHAVGIALGLLHGVPRGHALVRTLGALIGAGGLYFLVAALGR